MIRLNAETDLDTLNAVKKGDMVTDTFSKTGIVERVEVIDDALYRVYKFELVTGRVIEVKI